MDDDRTLQQRVEDAAKVRERAEAEAARRQETIDGLRALADALADSPQMPAPRYTSFYCFASRNMGEDESQAEWLARAARAVPGRLEKDADDWHFGFKREFGPFTYAIYAERSEVCEQRVVGERKVEQQVEVEPAKTETRTVTEKVTEWECAPILRAVPEGEVA